MVVRLSATERQVLQAFSVSAASIAGAALRAIVLFGSRARGEGHTESDLDVLVRVHGLSRQVRRSLQDAAYDATEGLTFSLNPCVVDDDAWPASAEPLAREVARDGVPLEELVGR